MPRVAPESDQGTSSNLDASTINQVANAILAQITTVVRQQTSASTPSQNQDKVAAHSSSSVVSSSPFLVRYLL